jgi:hypothetical protein
MFRRLFERLRDLVFGYDLFISYDFDEAGTFAAQLKTSLSSQRDQYAVSWIAKVSIPVTN